MTQTVQELCDSMPSAVGLVGDTCSYTGGSSGGGVMMTALLPCGWDMRHTAHRTCRQACSVLVLDITHMQG